MEENKTNNQEEQKSKNLLTKSKEKIKDAFSEIPTTIKSNNDQELDLVGLFQFFANGVRGFFNSIGSVIGFLVRSIWWTVIYFRKFIVRYYILAVVAVVLFGGSLFAYKKLFPDYSSSALVQSPYIRGLDFIEEVGKLNELLVSKEYDQVAKILKISILQAETLKGIEASNYNDYFNVYDYMGDEVNVDSLRVNSLSTEMSFVISLVATDRNSYPAEQFQKSLIDYFERSPYIARRIKTDEEALKNERERLIREIVQLDTLKSVINESIIKSVENKQQTSTLNIAVKEDTKPSLLDNPLQVHSEAILLYKRTIEIEKELQLQEKFTFVSDFSPFRTDKQKPYLYGMYGGLFGFVLVFFFASLKDFNAFLDRKEKELSSKA